MLADVKRLRFDIIVCRTSGRLEAVMDAIDMKTFGLMAAANVGSNHTRPRRLSPSPPPTSTAVFRVDCLSSMLRRKGVRVVSITEHADDTPTGKLMEAIIESVDEFYSENLMPVSQSRQHPRLALPA